MNTNPHPKADKNGWIALDDAMPDPKEHHGIFLGSADDSRQMHYDLNHDSAWRIGPEWTHWQPDLPPPCPKERTQAEMDLEAYGKWTEEHGRGPSGSCAWLAALAFERARTASNTLTREKLFKVCHERHVALMEARREVDELAMARDRIERERDEARCEASRLRRAIVAWWSVQGDRHKKGPVMSQVEEQNLLGICAETPPPWHTP